MKVTIVALSVVGTIAAVLLAVFATDLIVNSSPDNSRKQLMVWSLLILTGALATSVLVIVRRRRADRP